MLYIIVALASEAQAFVDKYKLQKEKLLKYKLFTNNKMKVIISGIGVDNARLATQTLIDYFDINDNDIYLNIGICGASKEYQIGDILEITAIIYQKKKYFLYENDKYTLECTDVPDDNLRENTIVDMESFGFYDAVIHSPAIKKMKILKVVSDHFEPYNITKDRVKQLIFNQLDYIFKL